jgi:hypothetical protein
MEVGFYQGIRPEIRILPDQKITQAAFQKNLKNWNQAELV